MGFCMFAVKSQELFNEKWNIFATSSAANWFLIECRNEKRSNSLVSNTHTCTHPVVMLFCASYSH